MIMTEYKRAYHAANGDKERAYRAANRDALRAYNVAYRASNLKTSRASSRKWAAENPDKVRARDAKRFAADIRRLPVWADLKQIEKFYADAQSRIISTGEPHQVDHVIPLQGELVSGLHVHTNLQVLSKADNLRKGNRYAS
jgi:hypothetical protein